MGVRGSCTLFSYFPFEIFYNIKGPRKQEFSTPIFHSPFFAAHKMNVVPLQFIPYTDYDIPNQ